MLHIVMKILDFQSFSCAFTMQDKAPLNRSVQFSNNFPEPYPPPPKKESGRSLTMILKDYATDCCDHNDTYNFSALPKHLNNWVTKQHL